MAKEKVSGAASASGNLTFRILVDSLAKTSGFPRAKVKAVLNSLAETSTTALKQGKTVQIAGLGTLRVKDKAPAEGDTQSSATKRVVLTVSKQLKTAVEGN